MIWLILLAATWLLLAAINDCYNVRIAGDRMQITPRLVLTTVEAGVLYALAFFVFNQPAALAEIVPASYLTVVNVEPPRIGPALFLLLCLPMLVLWRLSYIQIFTSATLRQRALVIGAGNSGRMLIRTVRKVLNDYEFVGFIDDDPAKQQQLIEGLPVLGNHDYLVRAVQTTRANEVILAVTHDLHPDLFKVLLNCYEQGIEIKPMSLLYEEVLRQVPVEHLEQQWFLVPSKASLPTFYRFVKRLLDIVAALVGFIVLAILFPFVILAIYMDSPGPIFYRQERVGKGGEPFQLIKFRSMIPNAEQKGQAQWANKDDPRITRLGKFLRRTRIDELPQVLNILKGDMSIVGPRPERPQFVDQLQEQIPYYRTRLSVKPGLTGWAQVNYRYGSSVEDALIKLQYDLYYIKNQSPLLDVLIICRTIGVVLALKGT